MEKENVKGNPHTTAPALTGKGMPAQASFQSTDNYPARDKAFVTLHVMMVITNQAIAAYKIPTIVKPMTKSDALIARELQV